MSTDVTSKFKCCGGWLIHKLDCEGYKQYEPSDKCETCNGYGYTLSVDRTGGSPDGYWKTPCPDCGEDDDE